ncbi:CPBP family intramembrane glutamic endopeptidase [Gracilinema caldarium]|uniref:CPBP family intramembrane glutamic endopeptidase n=1 Tax=Gracilinema caldarium TaxID=215591 RepID=UPI0026EF1EC9|nr:CPBP family intramembrane glutamic endopeptidase [Gracilinema caldarium]
MITQKQHSKDEISKELLYKNRVIKSLFTTFFIVITSLVNIVSIVAFYNGVVSTNCYFLAIDLVFLIMVVLAIFVLPYNHYYYGMNFRNLWENIKDGILFGIPFAIVALLYRYHLIKKGYEIYNFTGYFGFFSLIYPFVAVVQEISIKGILQSYFVKAFETIDQKKTSAIIVTSIVFSEFHAIYGYQAMIATFLYGIITGYIYEKHRSFVAVSIIHTLAGFALFGGSRLP